MPNFQPQKSAESTRKIADSDGLSISYTLCTEFGNLFLLRPLCSFAAMPNFPLTAWEIHLTTTEQENGI